MLLLGGGGGGVVPMHHCMVNAQVVIVLKPHATARASHPSLWQRPRRVFRV